MSEKKKYTLEQEDSRKKIFLVRLAKEETMRRGMRNHLSEDEIKEELERRKITENLAIARRGFAKATFDASGMDIEDLRNIAEELKGGKSK